MAGGLVGNMSYGAERSAARAGRYGAEQQGAAEAGGEPFASAPRGTVAGQADARTDLEYNWDKMLDVADSPAYQYSMMAGSVALPAVWAGGSAMLGGATLAGAGTAALTVAGPLTVAVAVGFAGGMVGAWAGGHVGNWIGDMMGLEPLAGPSDDPACKGDKIFHVRTNLVLGMMVAAVVVGAVVALAAASIAATIFTGGLAAPFIIAGIAGLAGGLAGGFVGGMANSLGQRGEEKGEIADGSPNVQFEGKPVSHVTAPVACRDHGPKQVAEGSETVFVNGWPIGRKGHKTTCDGTIQTGCSTIKLDQTTSAIRLDIDGGWAQRIVRSVIAISDFLPFPKGNKGPDAPAQRPRGENPPPRDRTPAVSDDKAPNHCCTREGDPVDVARGQVLESRVDIDIPGTIPLRLERHWAPGVTTSMGRGWSSDWSQVLELQPGGVVWINAEGARVRFHTPGDEVRAENLRYPHLELAGRRDGVMWIWDCVAQLFHVFAPRVGNRLLLSRIEDRNGNTISFTYGDEGLRRVAHSDGFALSVQSEQGLIRRAVLEATDVTDCAFIWRHTARGELAEVNSAQSGTLRYRYDEAGRLTGWADSRHTRAHYAYDAEGRVARNWSDSGHLGVTLDYDTAARRTRVTDSRGAVTLYDWTAQGLVWRRTDPLGHVWLTEWDQNYHILSETDPLGHSWRYDYDAKGRRIATTDPEGASTRTAFDADDRPALETDAAGNVTTKRHDARGNLIAIDDPAGGTTILRRGPKGQLLRIERPDGSQSRIYYDPLLRPAREQDAAGRVTHLRYDTEGRLVWRADPQGGVTTWDVTRGPDNPRGNARSVTAPDGAVTRVIRDSEGLTSAIIAPDGQTRRYDHGPFDLRVARIDALGHRLSYEHDSELRLIAVVDEQGQRHELIRDAAGHIVAERDFAGALTRYDNDAAGRMVAKTAPDGAETRYAWSPAGRLTGSAVTGQPDLEVRYQHDAQGRVTAADMPGAAAEFAFDALGRMTAERMNGREIRSDYAGSGTARLGRSGDVLALGFDWSDAGTLDRVRLGGRGALHFQHDARGQEVRRWSNDGFTLEQNWDAGGRLSAQLAGARGADEVGTPDAPSVSRLRPAAHRAWRHDAAGRVVAIEDRHAGETLLSYDPRGQVQAVRRFGRQGDGEFREYLYDASGDLAAVASDTCRDRVETAAGRVQRRGTVQYRHDACGRVIEKRVGEGPDAQVWHLGWNARNRLIRLETPWGAIWRYDYDAFGRRILRQRIEADGAPLVPAEGSAFQWDGDQIAAEAPLAADGSPDWAAAVSWVWRPDSFIPLARIASGRADYVVTDPLGTPRELLSADGADVVWRGQPGVWGRMVASGDGCPVRFQGQWEDAESGFHYNRFRYYDPDAAQYLSPDPIGLAGGTRPQAYVADPMGQVDPLGLKGCDGTTGTPTNKPDAPGGKKPATDETPITPRDRVGEGEVPRKTNPVEDAGTAGKPRRPQSRRTRYLGRTPSKNSATGRKVRERMREEGLLKYDPRRKEDVFLADDGKWYPVDRPNVHMGHHPVDAVDYWNSQGINHGPKSKPVREWMLDPDNYRFEYGPENSSRGGSTSSRYQDPPIQ